MGNLFSRHRPDNPNPIPSQTSEPAQASASVKVEPLPTTTTTPPPTEAMAVQTKNRNANEHHGAGDIVNINHNIVNNIHGNADLPGNPVRSVDVPLKSPTDVASQKEIQLEIDTGLDLAG